MNIGDLEVRKTNFTVRNTTPTNAGEFGAKARIGGLLLVISLAAPFLEPAWAHNPAFAAETLDTGKTTAQMVCASCHDTISLKSPRRSKVEGLPPPFVSIAQDPKMGPDVLRRLLQFPHGRMDNVTLTTQEIDALILYIESFRLRGAPKQ